MARSSRNSIPFVHVTHVIYYMAFTQTGPRLWPKFTWVEKNTLRGSNWFIFVTGLGHGSLYWFWLWQWSSKRSHSNFPAYGHIFYIPLALLYKKVHTKEEAGENPKTIPKRKNHGAQNKVFVTLPCLVITIIMFYLSDSAIEQLQIPWTTIWSYNIDWSHCKRKWPVQKRVKEYEK